MSRIGGGIIGSISAVLCENSGASFVGMTE